MNWLETRRYLQNERPLQGKRLTLSDGSSVSVGGLIQGNYYNLVYKGLLRPIEGSKLETKESPAAIKRYNIDPNTIDRDRRRGLFLDPPSYDKTELWNAVGKDVYDSAYLEYNIYSELNTEGVGPKVYALIDEFANPTTNPITGEPGVYLVMKDLGGTSLELELQNKPKGIGVEKTILFGLSILNDLKEAHKIGYINGDIKKGNIQITSPDTARLLDWTHAIKESQAKNLYGRKSLKGTIGYLAPEQIIIPANDAEAQTYPLISKRTDIFQMGIVLWEMVTGKDATEMMKRIPKDSFYEYIMTGALHNEIYTHMNVLGVPDDIQSVILKATQFDINKRYKDAGEMRDALLKAQRELNWSPQ